MTKKRELLIILLVSIVLTTLGVIVDDDPKELGVLPTAFEYFAMLTLIFLILSLIYFGVTFSFKKVKGLIS